MGILEFISEQLKDAMRAKNSLRLQVLRNIKGELLKIQTDGKNNKITQNSMTKIVKTLIKEKKESLGFATQANRQDFFDKESKILAILKTFLPEQLKEDEIIELIKNAIITIDAKGLQDIGKVMKQVSQDVVNIGKDVDMNLVLQQVKNKLK